MAATIKCIKCSGNMVRGLTKGTFTGWRSDGMTGQTQTVKYMCTNCGYIEERAVNSLYLEKTK